MCFYLDAIDGGFLPSPVPMGSRDPLYSMPLVVLLCDFTEHFIKIYVVLMTIFHGIACSSN